MTHSDGGFKSEVPSGSMLSPVAFVEYPLEHRLRDWVCAGRSGRAPEIRQGLCRAARRDAAGHPVRAPEQAPQAADFRAEFPAAVPWEYLASRAGLRAQSASTMRPCDCRLRG